MLSLLFRISEAMTDRAVLTALLICRDLQLDTQLMNAGLPVDGEDFLTMIELLGSRQKMSAVLMLNMATVTMEVQRTMEFHSHLKQNMKTEMADIVFSFDEKGNMESMDGYLLIIRQARSLKKQDLNTVLGMGTVFVVLIFISFIISLLRIHSCNFRRSWQVKISKAEAEEGSTCTGSSSTGSSGRQTD